MSDLGKIGIFIRRPRDFFTFNELARKTNAEFIIVPDATLTVFYQGKQQIKFSGIAHIEQFMFSINTAARIYRGNLLADEKTVTDDFFSKYDILIDSQKSIFLMHPALSHKKKILYFYDNTIPGYWPTVGFSNIDLVLTTGRYFNDMLRPFITTALVGNLYFEKKPSSPPRNFFDNFDKSKKTLLFRPTEDIFDSPAGFSGAINTISDKYNVIVQLPQNQSRNKNLFSLNRRILILDDSFDVRSIANLIDIVLSDNAVTVLEWLSQNKRCVILDAWSREFSIIYGYGKTPAIRNLEPANGLFAAQSGVEMLKIIDEVIQSPVETANLFASDFFEVGSSTKVIEAINRLIADSSAKSSSKNVLVFHPGDLAMQNFMFQYRLKNIYMQVSQIAREPILFKKILKIIRTFF